MITHTTRLQINRNIFLSQKEMIDRLLYANEMSLTYYKTFHLEPSLKVVLE